MVMHSSLPSRYAQCRIFIYGAPGDRTPLYSWTSSTKTLKTERNVGHLHGTFHAFEWTTALPIAALPATTRLVSELLNWNGEHFIKMTSTAVQLFDSSGYLLQGEQYLELWSKRYDLSSGPMPDIVHSESPIVQLNFDTLAQPVVFHWKQQDNSPTCEKRGYLCKLGKIVWSKWRRRYFTLHAEKGTLCYADSDKDTIYKGIIPLDARSVLAEDDSLNKSFITFAVNKGTRKEHNTWGFTLTTHSRTYRLSSDTKNGRREWMDAIREVAHTITSPSNSKKDNGKSKLAYLASSNRAGSAEDLLNLNDG